MGTITVLELSRAHAIILLVYFVFALCLSTVLIERSVHSDGLDAVVVTYIHTSCSFFNRSASKFPVTWLYSLVSVISKKKVITHRWFLCAWWCTTYLFLKFSSINTNSQSIIFIFLYLFSVSVIKRTAKKVKKGSTKRKMLKTLFRHGVSNSRPLYCGGQEIAECAIFARLYGIASFRQMHIQQRKQYSKLKYLTQIRRQRLAALLTSRCYFCCCNNTIILSSTRQCRQVKYTRFVCCCFFSCSILQCDIPLEMYVFRQLNF